MFKLFKISLFHLFICLSIAACQRKDLNKVRITVKLDSAANAEVDLVIFNLLNLHDVVLASTKLDSLGNGQFNLALDHSIFAYVKRGDIFTPLFLSPGDKQTIVAGGAGRDQILHYSGDGQAINEYLQKVRAVNDKYQFNDHRQLGEVELDKFLAKKDSLQNELAGLLSNFEKKETVSKDALQIMHARNDVLLYAFTQDYITARFGYDLNDPDISSSLKTLIKDLPQDSLGLASNMYEYGYILMGHLQSGIVWPAGDRMDSTKTDGPELDLPTFSDEEIELKHYIGPLKEYLKAANIDYFVRTGGLSKEVDLLWAKYRKEFRNPLYNETIQKSFDLWASLAPGKPAPDFTGTTADGKSISLSSLKGKLVYVDVWATWCGPCREEFPHSKKLMKAFEGNNKIIFLFVSTDQNIDSWKKLLQDKNIPKGMHMHQKQDNQPDAIWENYHLWGIPRYLLIDKEGKMLRTHAPTPSSDNIVSLLKGYLKES